MTAQLAPPIRFRAVDSNGNPIFLGQLFTYAAGTTTPQATYVDSTQTTQNTNPIILNAMGECSLWLDPTLSYKFNLTDQFGNQVPGYPQDNIPGGFGALPIAVSLIPTPTNSRTLGNSSFSWANVYVGPNNATVLDTVSGNIGYYARTAAEIAALITPTNFSYAPCVVDRYGTNVTPGTTDMTSAINAAIAVASKSQANPLGAAVTFMAGTYAFSSDLTIPMGDPFLAGGGTYAITLQGQGKEQTVLKAISGGSFTHGIYFNGGSSYKNMGTLRDLQINGNGLLSDGITLSFAQMGRIENVNVRSCTGRGLYLNNCLMTRLSKMFFTACGSASFAQVEIDATLAGSTGGTTTTVLDQIWIEGGNAGCVAGLNIDRSFNTTVVNGAFESTGVPVQISSKGTTVGCDGLTFDTVDFESPTTAYVVAGFGLSGSNFITSWDMRNCTGENPGTVGEAVLMQQCAGARFVNNNWLIGGSMTSIYNLFGTSNTSTTIEPHPAMNTPASTVPWVRVNNTPVRSAGPLGRWDQASTPGAPLLGTKNVTSLVTWTPWIDGNSVNQGGWYSTLIASNTGAMTVFSMDGDPNMEISIIGDGFSTLLQGTSGQAFDNVSGANLLLLANHLYRYRYDGSRNCWRQLGTA